MKSTKIHQNGNQDTSSRYSMTYEMEHKRAKKVRSDMQYTITDAIMKAGPETEKMHTTWNAIKKKHTILHGDK